MRRCSVPPQPGDPRYVLGECTWHAPIAAAALSVKRTDASSHGEEPNLVDLQVPCCPHCGGMLFEFGCESDFWADVQLRERDRPGYEALLRWSQGMCFPDFDTLESAYRQAAEGQG